MSCDIREYESIFLGDEYCDTLRLTAFCGNKKHGNMCVQFTIGGRYCALSEHAVKDLIKVLEKRLKCANGYSSTGNERKVIKYK